MFVSKMDMIMFAFDSLHYPCWKFSMQQCNAMQHTDYVDIIV